MDKKTLNLLILEDNPDDVVLILKELERDGFTVKYNRVETKKAFKEALAEKPDIILSDYQLPSFSGIDALEMRRKLSPDIPMIIISGSIENEIIIECMQNGATDYILKDKLSLLGSAVNRAFKEADERLQRKRAEEKIMDSEERFRILFESAKDGFFLLDKNWKYIDVNPAYCRMFGYTRDEFLQSDMMLVFFLYDIEKAFEDGKSIRKDKYFFPEYRMRKKDKSEIWVDLTITPFNAGGEELMLGIIRDVTERKRTAEALRESEELFRNIFETTPGFLLITDEKGNNIYISPNCKKITGYTQKELKDKIIWWVHEDDTPRAKEIFDKTFSEGIGYKNFEYKFVTKKGELRYALSSWEPLKDKNGKFKGIVLQTIDVTKRKQVEGKLIESEEKYRDLIETMKEGVLTVDKNENITFVNQGTCGIFKYSQKELIGKNIKELTTPEEFRKIFKNTSIRKSGKSGIYELTIIRKDGEAIIISVSASPVTGSDGKYQGSFGIFHDITERKRAEEKLIESEEKYRTLVENIQDGVFLIQDKKLLFINEAFAGIAGCTIEEIIGKGFSEFVALEDLDMVKDRYDRMMAGEDVPMEYEFRGLRKKGDERSIVYMNVGLVNYQGKKAALGTIKDITESKRAEQTLRESRERLDFAVTGANLGLWDINIQTGDAVYNKQWAEMLGYTINEIEPKSSSWENLIHADDLSKVTEISKAHFEKKKPYYIAEFRIRAKSGEWKWILSTGKVFEWDEAGKPLRMTGLHQDITERKRAEEKLIESEEKYRQLAETAKDIILLCDLKGNVKYANRESLRIAGYNEKEALQMNIMDMLSKDCIQATKERFIQRRKGIKDIFVYDAEFINKKGYKIPVEVKSSLIAEQGKPSGVLIIARDITERKLAEETLKQKIIELKSFIDNIPDMAWLKDTDSRFIAVNRALCETIGIDAQSLINQNCEEYFGKEVAEKFKKDDKEVMKGGKQIIVEEKILDSKKNTVWLETIKSPIFDESGKALGTVGIARDINERKQSEKRIERLNNALKAVRSVDQLIIVEKYRNSLLQKACDIMIETRGYEGAWLGFLNDEKNFDVVKGSGLGEDVSRFINHVISGDYPRCIGKALSDGNSFILIDKSKDCEKCFFKKPCAGKEAAIIQVEHDGRLFGLMAILFAADISVDDEEKELLKELAGDIGLALYNMELKESSRRSEETLKHKLLALSQPVYEISGLQLTDIIDIDILQKLQDSFAESYGVASLIFDNNGKQITTPSNFSDFCKIIRSTKKGMERCEISDENLTKLAAKNASVITSCKNFKEILDAAVPVFIGDKQVAAWGVGQKLIGELSEDKVRSYAREIGADDKQLIAASKKLESGSKEQFERIVSFIKTIAKNISLLGLQNIQQAREITERSRAEETLKESEDKYRRLTETVTDIIFTLNMKGEFIYLSPVFEKVTGYTAQDYIGRPFTEVVTPDYIESTVDKFKRVLTGEKIPLYEIELIHKDKKRISVELNVTSLLDSRGQIIGRHGVARDISMRKQSEEELRKKNEELEIFNKMAVGRELKMIELKKEINQLLMQSGKKTRYKIAEKSKAEEGK